MYDIGRVKVWSPENGENIEEAKRKVFDIINEYQIPLVKVRCLFVDILEDIEDKNIVKM